MQLRTLDAALTAFIVKTSKVPEWQRIHQVADKAVPVVESLFELSLQRIRDGMNLTKISEAFKTGSVPEVEKSIPWELFDIKFAEIQAIFYGLIVAGGNIEAEEYFQKYGKKLIQKAEVDPAGMFSFNMRNPNAIKWAAEQSSVLIREVSTGTRDGVRGIITDAFTSGGHPYETAKLIRQNVGLLDSQIKAVDNYRKKLAVAKVPAAKADKLVERYTKKQLKRRTENISRTETINSACAGQQLHWEDMINKGYLDKDTMVKEWQVSPDDRLCEICQASSGTTAPIDGVFPNGKKHPTLHPSCVIGSTQISSRFDIRAITRRAFEGEVFVIKTAFGSEITCTPNHPILTTSGWVGAGLFNIGDNIIGYRGSKRLLGVKRKNQNVPSNIEDMSKAFFSSSDVFTVPVPVSAPDFHNDGIGSKVAVIGTYSKLRDGFDSAFLQHFCKALFICRVVKSFFLERLGVSNLGFESGMGSQHGGVGRGSLVGSLQIRHPRPFQAFRLALVSTFRVGQTKLHGNNRPANAITKCKRVLRFTAQVCSGNLFGWQSKPVISRAHLKALLFKEMVQGAVSDINLSRQSFNRFSREIFIDQVIRISRKPFSGHVYNLQSDSGIFIANNIITHNCRCAIALKEVEEAASQPATVTPIETRVELFPKEMIQEETQTDPLLVIDDNHIGDVYGKAESQYYNTRSGNQYELTGTNVGVVKTVPPNESKTECLVFEAPKSNGFLGEEYVDDNNRNSIFTDGRIVLNNRSANNEARIKISSMLEDEIARLGGIRKDGVWYRSVDNPKELGYLKNGTIKPSVNHLTNTVEDGLSVWELPKYAGKQGTHRVSGKLVGIGSDGEPLIDVSTVKLLPKLEKSVFELTKIGQELFLRKYNWTAEQLESALEHSIKRKCFVPLP